MAKNQNTIEKRRREMEKKRKAEEKKERRNKKKEQTDIQATADPQVATIPHQEDTGIQVTTDTPSSSDS